MAAEAGHVDAVRLLAARTGEDADELLCQARAKRETAERVAAVAAASEPPAAQPRAAPTREQREQADALKQRGNVRHIHGVFYTPLWRKRQRWRGRSCRRRKDG